MLRKLLSTNGLADCPCQEHSRTVCGEERAAGTRLEPRDEREPDSRAEVIRRLRGSATIRMTTEQIMALTRGR
ncbi:MAG: hypothetical protein WD673_00745 [Alphaproteobacteria bacterium]